MLADLPVSIQTQDMNRQRLAIAERAWREQRSADDVQEVSVLQPTVSMIVMAKIPGSIPPRCTPASAPESGSSSPGLPGRGGAP
jgi:hypothetical protein